MSPLSFQKCYHHSNREAVVRCPVCLKDYCRECVTEHDDRMLCTGCLKQYMKVVPGKSRRWIFSVVVFIQCSMGFFILWYGFFLLGKMLLATPSSFHEGTLWQSNWWFKP